MTLLAAYGFGGSGSTIADDSGNGHSFTLDANSVRAAGGGLTRTTTGQTVGPAVFGQTANRSISGRLARTSTSLDAWFPGWDLGGTGQWGLIDLGGQRQARARNSGGVATAQVAATTGEVAFACTYDGSNIRLYIGGALVATTALAGPLLTTATTLYILNGTGTETTIKDLRIYDHVLTLAEVQSDRDTPVSGGGVTLNLGQAAGSGAAQALSASKALNLGAASGAGTPQAMAFTKALGLGAASGSGAPAAIALSKALGLGQAAGSGAAQALGPSKAWGLQTATGSGAAQAAGFTAGSPSSMDLGTAAGVGSPQAMTFTKALGLGTASGAGSPRALSNAKGLALGVAAGIGAAKAMELTGPIAPYTAASDSSTAASDEPAYSVSSRSPEYAVTTRSLTPTVTAR